MNSLAVLALRVVLVLIVLCMVLGQVFLVPVVAADLANTYPEMADLRAPYTVVVNLGLGCVQIALVAVWVLLSMVRGNAIFTARAFAFVDLIIGAAGLATLLAAGLGLHAFGAMRIWQAVLPLGATVIVGGAFVLLMLILRGLLRRATALERELAAQLNSRRTPRRSETPFMN